MTNVQSEAMRQGRIAPPDQLPGIVAERRRRYALLKQWHDMAVAEWQAQNAERLASLTKAAEDMAQAEAALRDAALSIYAATQNRKPLPGTEVVMAKQVDYNEAEALGWATFHKMALKLDKTAFERIAKAQDGLKDAEDNVLATVKTVPMARLAQDMDAAIEKAG